MIEDIAPTHKLTGAPSRPPAAAAGERATDGLRTTGCAPGPGQLRAGSTATWAEFLADGVRAPRPSSPGRTAPLGAHSWYGGLAASPEPGLPDFAGLADLVLSTPPPGRGLVDTPLPWPEREEQFGTPAVAPEELPAEELLRVASRGAGPAAHRAPRGDLDEAAPRPAARGRWRPWRRRFTLMGAPLTAELVRAALRARGLREGGTRRTYLVLAAPLEQLMFERWSARVRAGGACAGSGCGAPPRPATGCPRRSQVDALATRLAEHFGAVPGARRPRRGPRRRLRAGGRDPRRRGRTTPAAQRRAGDRPAPPAQPAAVAEPGAAPPAASRAGPVARAHRRRYRRPARRPGRAPGLGGGHR